jgi:uncharacterized membrane protein YraQ (UPF0718 family)
MDIFAIASSRFAAVYDYMLAHTLVCLVSAFFIAGAMAALMRKNLILPYLGKDSPKHFACPLSVASDLLLAVYSCTVLPLFAGIKNAAQASVPRSRSSNEHRGYADLSPTR